MAFDLTLEIENVGPISQAKIDIGKINIIGGKNSTGKSTSSKLLYCFLRANSNFNEDLLVEGIRPRLFRFTRELYYSHIISSSLMRKMDLNDPSLDELMEYYEELKFRYFQYENKNESKLSKKPRERFEDDEYDYRDTISDAKSHQYLRNKPKFKKHIERIDEMINIEQKPNKLFQYLVKRLIMAEFSLRSDNLFKFGKNSSFFSPQLNFNCKIDFEEASYKKEGIFNIEDVFYLDSFSTFDLPLRKIRRIEVYGNAITDHATKLSKSIYDETEAEVLFDDIDNKEIIEIEENIKTIIGGKLEIEEGQFIYKTTKNSRYYLVNTASGIKQIGTIQKLLSNRKLKPESYLIIDEPEVNLHPEWQVKFAEILVLLASDLDINIYINTHSPMFIEAMCLYSEYYGLLEETNIYLSKLDKNYVAKDKNKKIVREGQVIEDTTPKFTFEKIDPKDMGAVYENLSRPYDDLDDLKSKILFKNS